jgi:hypothetical protein
MGIPWEVLERDYLLSWVLAGVGQTPTLRDKLVFKGGTALRKCYFGDYREQSLGPLVPGLPSFETVADALRPEVAALVRSDDKR